MRGVVLAGGRGTRLGELTKVTNKHLLPVGPYPMIYYPIKKLVGAGITDIMLVSGTEHVGDFVRLLGSGRDMDCKLTYRVQDEAGGIAQALGLAEDFCIGHRCTVLLGDNIFLDKVMPNAEAITLDTAARIVVKTVNNPSRYGVVEFDGFGRIVGIEEKPSNPKSNCAVTGIYSFPKNVFGVIRGLKPSARGELEITDVIRHYLEADRLTFEIMHSQCYWTDAGTIESLAEANRLVAKQEPRF